MGEEFIEFVEKIYDDTKRKTKIYAVMNKHHGDELGEIKWYGAWHQFTFFPARATVWSIGCMQQVMDFIRQLMEERKQK
jgi:hypothetical protein